MIGPIVHLTLICAALASALPASADPALVWRAAAESLKANGVNAISIRSLPDGQERVAIASGDKLRLASVTKVLLAGAALSRLSAGHRFHTEVFATGVRGSTSAMSVETLYVRGHGDPFLLAEEWGRIASALPIRELRGDLVIDDSYFADDPGITYEQVPNPYNAPSAAVSAEFNRITVLVQGKTATAISNTRMTPFTRFDIRPRSSRVIQVRQRLVGDRLDVQVRGPARRSYGLDFHIGHERGAAAYYSGHLFALLLRDAGRIGPRTPKIRRGLTPNDAIPIYRFEAPRTLAEVLAALLEYSNNFIANQLFLTLGAEAAGAPGTANKGRQAIAAALGEIGGLEEISLVDGSGLDPANRGSARALTHFLAVAAAKQPELIGLLHLRAGGAARAKTGTFRDKNVRALAGYLVDRCDKPYATFAFLCDGKCSRETVRRYDDALERIAREAPPPSDALCAGVQTATSAIAIDEERALGTKGTTDDR